MTTLPFRRLPAESFPTVIEKLGLALLTIVIMAIAFMLPDTLGLPVDRTLTIIGVPMAVLAAYLVWQNERIWILAAVLSHLLMMLDSTRDAIGIGEMSFGLFGLLGLALWFCKELGIQRRRIVETGFDLLLMSFLVVSTITTLLANVLHGGSILLYFKEYGVVVDLLLYFPLKKVVRRREDVILLIALFIVVGLVNGVFGFYTYKERLAQAVFQWQVTASRSNINESTSLALFILASTLFAYSRRIKMQIFSLALAAGALVFLVISFSRSPIVAALLGMMIMMILSPWRNGRRVVLALGLALAGSAAIALVAFPEIASSIGSSVAQRILTLSQTTSDRSFNARLVEAGTILDDYVRYSPVIGNGFGVPYKFRDPIMDITLYGTFVHNGYIWSIFKFGIPLALMWLWMMLYPLVRLLVTAPKRYEGFNRALMAGSVAYLICAFIVHFTSNVMTQVSTILNIVICWVLLDYVTRQVRGAAESEEIALPSGAVDPHGDT